MRCKVADIKEKQPTPKLNNTTKKRKSKLRENIESIVFAIAIAFAIRYFVVEAFKIPTGSMAPTLLGEHKDVKCPNCGWSYYADRQSESATCPKCQITIPWVDLSNRIIHGGNRILVNKFWLKFKNPQRWDVTVFVYPLYDLTCKSCSAQMPDTEWHDGLRCPRCGSARFSKKKKNYIKRLIGLPGEKLQIVNGDIYINDKIQRKPDSVQDTLWLPVYNSRYSTKEEAIPTWVTDSNAWTIHKDSLTLNNTSQGSSDPSLVTLGRRILDHN